MTDNIKWAPIIPLIGGFPIGAEKALGTAPEGVFSYTAFGGNDHQYINYMNNTRGLDIPVHLIDQNYSYSGPKIDIFVSTCPCAALSQLNTGKSASAKGADADSAKWMLESSEFILANHAPRVLVGENAPALATNKGKKLVDKLVDIADKFGYSFSLLKTNTRLHGVPQSRERSFYFFWDNPTAPVMEYYNRPRTDFPSYLKEIPADATQQDWIVNPRLGEDAYYAFIKAKFPDRDPRQVIIGNYTGNTAHNWVKDNGLMQEFVDWCQATGHEKGLKYGTHAMKKFADNKGIWDGSTHVFGDYMNAVIGRNMADTIHPTEDRSLNVREALHMMAFPHDFELQGKQINHIAQNVPVCTARDVVLECAKYVRGELAISNAKFLKQNNHKQIIEERVPLVGANTLMEFI